MTSFEISLGVEGKSLLPPRFGRVSDGEAAGEALVNKELPVGNGVQVLGGDSNRFCCSSLSRKIASDKIGACSQLVKI